MSKEKLLKEFKKKYFSIINTFDSSDNCYNAIEDLFIKAIDQTREEMIRDCEGVLPKYDKRDEDVDIFQKSGWNNAITETRRAVKSLINLRQK